MIDLKLNGVYYKKNDTHTNKNGCLVERAFCETERYHFDWEVCPSKEGWKQYDTSQDAWYYGIWVNVEKRLIVFYAEGDIDVTTCPTVEALRAELADMETFYGSPPPMAICYDADGSVTKVYDERPKA